MVESTALEMRRTFTGTVGSNPTLSANFPSILDIKPSPRAMREPIGARAFICDKFAGLSRATWRCEPQALEVDAMAELPITRRGAILAVPAITALASTPALAVEASALDPNLRVLSRAIGAWRGAGEGEPGVSEVERTYEPALGGKFIVARNTSRYAPQPKNPRGEVHQDIGWYSFDKATRSVVLRQFHVEGFVSLYAAPTDSLAGDTWIFNTTALENIPAGFRARETYTFRDDTLEEHFELAEPGKAFTTYSRNRLRRG